MKHVKVLTPEELERRKKINTKIYKYGCLPAFSLLALLFIYGIIGDNFSEKAKYKKAIENFKERKYEKALHSINWAIDKDSTNSDYYELRGKILDELQDTIHSKEDFIRTLNFAATDSAKDKKIKEIIDWDITHGKKEEAKEFLKKELSLYKDDTSKKIEIMEYASRKFLIIGDTLEAIKLLNKLEGDNSQTGKFHNHLGVIYSLQNDNRKAIKKFKAAIKIEPNNNSYLYNLGISYLNVNNKSKAKAIFQKSMNFGNYEACKEYRQLSAKTRYRKKSKCCDGTTSSSTGRGACSHHGGVCRIINVPYKEYTIRCKKPKSKELKVEESAKRQ